MHYRKRFSNTSPSICKTRNCDVVANCFLSNERGLRHNDLRAVYQNDDRKCVIILDMGSVETSEVQLRRCQAYCDLQSIFVQLSFNFILTYNLKKQL